MRLTVIAIVCSTLMTGAAHASETLAGPPLWSGAYLGLNGSSAHSRQRLETLAFPIRGASLGATIGFNHRLADLVIGVEADANWARIRGSIIVGGPDDRVTRDIRSYGTLRLRAGYAFGRLLAFASGGAYWQRSRVGVALPSLLGPGGEIMAREASLGWTAGAGVEVALTPHLSWKAEYLYARSSPTYLVPLPFGTIVAPTRGHLDILRTGLNYQF